MHKFGFGFFVVGEYFSPIILFVPNEMWNNNNNNYEPNQNTHLIKVITVLPHLYHLMNMLNCQTANLLLFRWKCIFSFEFYSVLHFAQYSITCT